MCSGEVTTPQLHFCVSVFNSMTDSYDLDSLPSDDIVSHCLSVYYHTLFNGFQQLRSVPLSVSSSSADNNNSNTIITIILDAANGVGSLSADEFMRLYSASVEQDEQQDLLPFECRNRAREGPVNENCGAELVQKNQQRPFISGLQYHNGEADSLYKNQLFCSFDGDADRIIFHGIIENNNGILKFFILFVEVANGFIFLCKC